MLPCGLSDMIKTSRSCMFILLWFALANQDEIQEQSPRSAHAITIPMGTAVCSPQDQRAGRQDRQKKVMTPIKADALPADFA